MLFGSLSLADSFNILTTPPDPMIPEGQHAIIHHCRHKQGLSISEIARQTGISRPTVRRVLKTTELKERCARSIPRVEARRARVRALSKITETVNGRVLPKYPSAATIQAALVREGIRVSKQTVFRDLCTTHECVVRPQRPFDSAASIAKRQALKEKYEDEDDDIYVFTDEHWVTTNDHTCKTQWVTKRVPGEERTELPLPRIIKSRYNIPSVMIWGAVGVGYKGPLVFIPRKTNEDGGTVGLNSKRYVRTCLSKLFSGSNPIPPDRIFMQDGARCHSAKATLAYLERKGQKVIDGWPPYSPDLTPIENIWAWLDKEIAKSAPDTLPKLRKATYDAWDALPQELVDNYVRSFKRRLQTHIK